MKTLTDLSLIAQAVIGHNRRAFDTLVRKHQSQVRRFFLHQTLGDEFLSDDLAQETFIRAWLGLGSFRGLSDYWTHCLRAAKECANSLRWRHMSTSIRHSPSCALTSGRA